MEASTPTCCPACGSQLKHSRPIVDLDENCISYGGKVVRLSPSQTVIVHMLAQRSPATVNYERLAFGLYGARSGPQDAVKTVRVIACNARKRLHQLGLTIETVPTGGMALRLLEDA